MGVPSGPFYIDDTLTFTTISHRFDTGALTDADGVPAYRIYEDETGTAILTGNMAKLDDASTTGFYSEQITLSAANGFEVGKSYAIYVTAAVNSVTGGQTFNFKVIATPATAPTAAAIADAVWDEAQADHVAAGSFGVTASEIADILVDTAEIGAAGAGLTNINLPNQTMDIIGSITGNLSGSVGSVTGAVGSVTGAVGSVGAGGITAASFAANAITAAKLDPDVTTELQAGLATAAALAVVDGIVDDILLDTAEIGAAGAGLTAINLPDQTMNITGNITGNLSGSVGSVTGGATAAAVATLQTSVDDLPTNAELATSQAAADDATLAAIAALNNLSAAQVNAEVVDALATDTYAEPTGVPAATNSLAGKIGVIAMVARNRIDITASAKTVYDDGGAAEWKKVLSDDGTTYTEAEASAP
jgi:hypothetical protein